MGITTKQRLEWRAQMLRDYPRLAEIDKVVDTLLDLYDKDEKAFHEQVKKEIKNDRKKKKVEEPPAKKPEDFILKGLIERIEAKDVVKGITPLVTATKLEEDIHLGDDGMIKV